MKTLITALAALLFSGFATAKDATQGPSSFFDSQEFGDSIFFAALVLDQYNKPACSKDFSIRVPEASPGPNYQADASGKPTGKSQVLVKVEIKGCPAFTRFVTILSPNPLPNERPALLPKMTFKGDTNASVQLFAETLHAILPKATTAILKCENASLTEAAIAKPLSGKLPAWTETWTFSGCGRTAKYSVRFQTDAKGETDFRADLIK